MKTRKRIGRGIGSGKGKTGGRGGKGQTARSGVAHQRLRGRPDAAASAPAEARLHQHLPQGLRRGRASTASSRRSRPAGSMPAQTIDAAALKAAGMIRRARDGVRLLGGAAPKRKLTHRRRRRVAPGDRGGREGGRNGEGRQAGRAGGSRSRLRARAGAHRSEHGLSSRAACRKSELRRLLQGGGAEEAHLVHARRAARLSARHLHPAARHQPRGAAAGLPAAVLRHPGHVQHVLRRRRRAHGDLRARHHALHLRLDHPAAHDGGRPARSSS